jgi:hypothetical protein
MVCWSPASLQSLYGQRKPVGGDPTGIQQNTLGPTPPQFFVVCARYVLPAIFILFYYLKKITEVVFFLIKKPPKISMQQPSKKRKRKGTKNCFVSAGWVQLLTLVT